MFHEILGVTTFVLLGFASAKLYEPDHRSRDYQKDRPGQIASPRGSGMTA